ncbi:hypothetical protein Pan97_53410 [Bremerella volcania]|uniref:Leucine Rich repeats (2 copies) n=1 Tax=Bremerella volcania TaxID=2527984 RepID=A0A518CGC3_9BACT|nr:hypothetical protein [Bremerella volcania]QDU78257.1 hypothetical protein Pan97_53410 [Bremerella volcania]
MKHLWPRLSLLKRLHRATWCAMLLTATALVLIMVPGESLYLSLEKRPQPWYDACMELEADTYQQSIDAMCMSEGYPENGSTICPPDLKIIEHGWPSPFLARAVVDAVPFPTGEEISWTNLENWPFSAENWLFRPGAFLLDFGIAILLIALAGALIQWRIHRRQGLLKFGLSDLLIGLTFLGLAMGYYTYHHRISTLEDQAIDPPQSFWTTRFGRSFYSGRMITRQNYEGPQWLRKLLGGDQYLELLYHDDYAEIQPGADWRSTFEAVTERPFIEVVDVREQLPLEAVEQLAKCPQLDSLILPKMDSKAPQRIIGTNDPVFQPQHLPQLRKLTLRTLVLRGNAIEPHHVETAAALPGLRTIYLQGTSVTEEELQPIQRRHPQVEMTMTDYIPF